MPVALVLTYLMLKITTHTDNVDRPLLRIEGQVAGPWVEALRRACDENMSGPDSRPIVLDLAGVSFIDAEGVALFGELASRHAKLTNGSVYVAEQLKEVVGHGNG
jgi:anti-anti-sigma factor